MVAKYVELAATSEVREARGNGRRRRLQQEAERRRGNHGGPAQRTILRPQHNPFRFERDGHTTSRWNFSCSWFKDCCCLPCLGPVGSGSVAAEGGVATISTQDGIPSHLPQVRLSWTRRAGRELWLARPFFVTCLAIVLATKRLKISPTTIPLTPPSGFFKAVINPCRTSPGTHGGCNSGQQFGIGLALQNGEEMICCHA